MMIRSLVTALVVLLGVGVTTARAEQLKCQRGLAKASAKYVQGRTKTLQKCESLKTKGALSPTTNCQVDDPKTVLLLSNLSAKLQSSIAKSCGGADKICGNGD